MIILFPLVGFWFWLYLIVSCSFLFTWAYKDEYTLCTLDVLVFLLLFSITGKIDVFGTLHYVRDNPAIIVAGVLAYGLIGTMWARLKWQLLLRKLKTRVDAERPTNPEKVLAEVPYALRLEGFKMVDGKLKLSVDHYRSRIIGWMAYWHVSAVMWLVGDFLRDVFDSLYRMVRGHFQSAADSMFD
jgi:hypothetical protein